MRENYQTIYNKIIFYYNRSLVLSIYIPKFYLGKGI